MNVTFGVVAADIVTSVQKTNEGRVCHGENGTWCIFVRHSNAAIELPQRKIDHYNQPAKSSEKGDMTLRKLRDWRKLLIYSHRWLGIGIIFMFLLWTLSGVVLMYYGHPQITTGERLLRMEPIDFSAATVTPAEAAQKTGVVEPYRIRLSMYNDRPVYRLTRVSIGNWRTIYADTGEVLPTWVRNRLWSG
jgi:hypothetical protein